MSAVQAPMPRWAIPLPLALAFLVGATVLAASHAVHADPEDDRKHIVRYFEQRYPDIRLRDYVHGALVFDPDAKAQHDTASEFAPHGKAVEKGEMLFKTPFRNGKTYADCLPRAGRMLAGDYPRFDEAAGRVVTFEDLLNACRVRNGEQPYDLGDMSTMGLLSAYARSLSNGMTMNVRVDTPAARAAYEDGKRTFYARHGQLNHSCAGCHIDNAGYRLRSDLLSPVLGQATHWPVFRSRDGGLLPTTLQGRYADCFRAMLHVPDKAGSSRFNNLEYFHSYLSNGLEMRASVLRR